MRDAMTTSNRNAPDNGCATASTGTARRRAREKPSMRPRMAKFEDHDRQSSPRQGPAKTTQSKLATVRPRQSHAATIAATLKSP